MTERQNTIIKNVQAGRDLMLEAERWLWRHPQTGYQEWEAHGYLTEKLEKMGFQLTPAGNIPGFYTDIDTGIPGPKMCILCELDALDLASHPAAVCGAAHACGHHAQGAILLGVAAALLRPGALDGMSGSIRLMAVPAEEGIQFPFREELRKKGVIRFFHGKPEFMYRGFFDGVDIAAMVHAETGAEDLDFNAIRGRNGLLLKEIVYRGVASHAGGSPHRGINAQYAAMLGLQACNDLRETFQEKDAIRFHPVLRGSSCGVNVIPDEVRVESMVRGRTLAAICAENQKINRALSGAALALGARVEIRDRAGCGPEYHDEMLMRLADQCCAVVSEEDRVGFAYDRWSTGSSDFGDLTGVMPGIQFHACGAQGAEHGADYRMADPERCCLNGAKALLLLADALLAEGAARAKEIIARYRPAFSSVGDYVRYLESMDCDREPLTYHADTTVTVDYR